MPEEKLLNDNSEDVIPLEEDTLYPQEDETTLRQYEENPDEAADENDIPIDEDLTYAAIKGIFFTPKADNAGAFCIIYRGETGKVIFRELWAIRSNTRPNSDISDTWENFIKDMNKIGTYDKDSSEKWLPLIVQSLTDSVKEYLFRNIYETEDAQTAIRKALEKLLHYVVELEIGVELLGEERAEKGGIIRGSNKEEPAASTAEAANSEAILDVVNIGKFPLTCQPVINPVSGCPVANLKVGDVVHVVIPETNDVAKKVVDYLRAEGEVPAFPVVLIQPLESGKCIVVLKINDEISGILNLSPDIMLKTNMQPRMELSPLKLIKQKLLNPANFLLYALMLFIFVLLYFITHFLI